MDDNFFELGGGSLIAAPMFVQINKEYGKLLPLATLLGAPTVEGLARLLRETGHESPWSSLVEIQAGSSLPPLFLVHAEGGNVLGYRDLARYLGVDLPVFGLQARGLNGGLISGPVVMFRASKQPVGTSRDPTLRMGQSHRG